MPIGLVEPQNQALAKPRLKRFARTAAQFANGFKAHLRQCSDLLLVKPEGGDRQTIEHCLDRVRGNNLAACIVAYAPCRSNGWGDCACDCVTESAKTCKQCSQEIWFAPEEMIDASGVENEVSELGVVLDDRHKRAGIGVPVSKIGKACLQPSAIHFPHHEGRDQRTGIGQGLPLAYTQLARLPI
jgi:hypothetical protein